MKRREFLALPLAGVALHANIEPPGELPFRQVHLDFHNSELIPDIAADFNAREFMAALQKARVQSVNVFAKCIHGYAYYETKLGTRHPSLKIDLLGEMLRALREAGIAANYYYVLTWDLLAARRHPEWRMLDRNRNVVNMGRDWPQVCLNSPYFDQVVRENEEILAKYRATGCWFDILYVPPGGCFCPWCLTERQALNLTDSRADLRQHNKLTVKRVAGRLTALARRHWPEALVFYNGRTAVGMREELPNFSHIEIESLPTGGWGYTHFQHRVRYARTLGKQVVGMNGRFHKSWGDFGGLKNQAALDYEALAMIANGAKVCVGDQLHPRGRLDRETFARIGATFARIEALEPYLKAALPTADIGVVSALTGEQNANAMPVIDAGFTNMLTELHQQFDVLDDAADFAVYKVIVLPDEIAASPELLRKLDAHIARGGAVLATHRSVIGWPPLGVRHQGPAKFAQGFFFATDPRLGLASDYAWFLYQPGSSVEALEGTQTLAVYGDPYFDRSRERFMGHRQAAAERKTDRPFVTLRGRVAYIANPFFRSYAEDAYGVYRDVVGALLRELLPKPAVKAPGLPRAAQVTCARQGNRTIVHVLYYPMTRSAPNLDIIEHAGILKDVRLAVRCDAAPRQVNLAPSRRAVPFRYRAGYAEFTLPWVDGYQAVAIV